MIWLAPAPLLALPYVVVLLNEQSQVARPLDTAIIAPGILAMLGAMHLGLEHAAVTYVAAGVFWYAVGVSLLNSLIGRPTRASRVVLILLCTAAFLMAMIGWSLRGWSPD